MDFYFWAAGFFRGFCRRIFASHFCGKKSPEKSSGKIPGKILQNLYNKNPPDTFLQRGRAKISNSAVSSEVVAECVAELKTSLEFSEEKIQEHS